MSIVKLLRNFPSPIPFSYGNQRKSTVRHGRQQTSPYRADRATTIPGNCPVKPPCRNIPHCYILTYAFTLHRLSNKHLPEQDTTTKHTSRHGPRPGTGPCASRPREDTSWAPLSTVSAPASLAQDQQIKHTHQSSARPRAGAVSGRGVAPSSTWRGPKRTHRSRSCRTTTRHTRPCTSRNRMKKRELSRMVTKKRKPPRPGEGNRDVIARAAHGSIILYCTEAYFFSSPTSIVGVRHWICKDLRIGTVCISYKPGEDGTAHFLVRTVLVSLSFA